MGMYNGLSAGLLRQATYSMARLGVFNSLIDTYQQRRPGDVPFAYKVAAGVTAGALGSIVGTPADLALIRMTSDKGLPGGGKPSPAQAQAAPRARVCIMRGRRSRSRRRAAAWLHVRVQRAAHRAGGGR